jgi:hypothetical protein
MTIDRSTRVKNTADNTPAIVQLTLSRFREFYREPEAVFWVFIFPILLAAGLGIAFRNRPAEASHIAVARSVANSPIVDSLKNASGLVVDVLDDTATATALRTGAVALVVVRARMAPSSIASTTRDPSLARRAWSSTARTALWRAAGPVPVTETKVSERGSRYIDFVVPGLLGMNLAAAASGVSVRDRRRAKEEAAQAAIATPMSARSISRRSCFSGCRCW